MDIRYITLADSPMLYDDDFEEFADEVAALNPGDLMKLNFQTDGPGEAMWVEITGRDGDGGITGTLRNDPVFADLSYGDEIEFDVSHVWFYKTADQMGRLVRSVGSA